MTLLTINISQQGGQILLLNELERNSNNMTHKLPNRVIKSGNFPEQAGIGLGLGPENGKIALLQDVGQVDNFAHIVVGHLGGQQQTLAQHKVSVWKVGQRLEQNGVRDVEIQEVRIELIQLEHRQIGLQVVVIALCLLLNVVLNGLKVFRIVAAQQ